MATFAPENTITFGSFSKAFAMTGWRIGYMIAPDYINEVAKLINEGVTYSAPTLSQQAGIYALQHFDEFVDPIVEVFQTRLEYVAQRVAKIPFLSLHQSKEVYTPSLTFKNRTNFRSFCGKAFKRDTSISDSWKSIW